MLCYSLFQFTFPILNVFIPFSSLIKTKMRNPEKSLVIPSSVYVHSNKRDFWENSSRLMAFGRAGSLRDWWGPSLHLGTLNGLKIWVQLAEQICLGGSSSCKETRIVREVLWFGSLDWWRSRRTGVVYWCCRRRGPGGCRNPALTGVLSREGDSNAQKCHRDSSFEVHDEYSWCRSCVLIEIVH